MKVTLLLSTNGLDESADTPESVQLLLVGVFGEASNCSNETLAPIDGSGRSRTKLRNRCPSGDCGRDTHYWAPPAQNRTGSFPAYGAHLGCLTAGLGLPYALRRR